MWNSFRSVALRRFQKYLLSDEALTTEIRFLPASRNGRCYRRDSRFYSILTSERQCSQRADSVNEIGSTVAIEDAIRDAKLLLELETVPSLASLTLKSLFNNQADIIRSHMSKLIGSHHPILRLARDFYQENISFFQNEDSTLSVFEDSPTAVEAHSSLSIQLRAIMVLLVAKSIGFPPSLQEQSDAEIIKNIQNKQRRVGEITEMMHTAYTLHQTVVNIPSHVIRDKVPVWFSDPVSVARLNDGNNLAALMGDFLLAKSSGVLSSLKNSVVTELMTNTIIDFAESRFVTFGSRSGKLPEMTRDMWFRKNRLGTGSLLRNACYSCLIFSGHDEPIRNLGAQIGEKLGLLLQATKELGFFAGKTDEIPIQFDLGTLPVINAVQSKIISTERLTLLSQQHDYKQIYTEVISSPEVINSAISTVVELQKQTETLLKQLHSSEPEAVSFLIHLMKSVTAPVIR